MYNGADKDNMDGPSSCSKCSSVIGQLKSTPGMGPRMTPMIPPRNSLAVGGVATCAVASPQ